MIRSFAHKGLEQFFREGSKAGIQPAHAKRLRMILMLLNRAKSPEAMSFAGSHLHRLAGHLEGHWSVRVNGPWRITFRFEGQDAVQVNYAQYH